LLSTS